MRKLVDLLQRRRQAEAPPPGASAADLFDADAHRALLEQEPVRARLLLKAFWVVVVVGVAWAALTQVDEVTRGEGRVIPSRQLQVLQSMDGGMVSEILVREGDVVQAGQTLVSIDPTRFDSSLQENRAQYLALVARAARLRALAEGSDFVVPPEVQKDAPRTLEAEQRSFEASRSTLAAQLAVAQQQVAQRRQELSEATARRDQAQRSHDLTARELSYTRPLVRDGAVSEVDILRLERDVSRFLGERDMAAAQILRSQSGIAEVERKVQEITATFRSEVRKELTETLGRLQASSASGLGLADRVEKSALKSPVRGTVKRLLVNTVGGVVQPGKDVVEIVPLEESLLIDARVPAKDIGFLRPGARAVVKFTAYDFAIYGGLEAKVEVIGADSSNDDKGNTFYMVRLRTERSQLGRGLPIIPGMVAEADILTGRKSVLSYLLKPVLRARQVAFTER